jgi:hypothetical protein
LKNAVSAVFHVLEDLRPSDQPALQNLVQAGAKFAIRQRRQHRRIDQHRPRMMERSHQILALRKVNPRLPPDRRVYLSEQRRRHLNNIDSAHVNRSRETSHVADYAAAEGDQERSAIRPATHHLAQQAFRRPDRLVALPVRNLEEHRIEATERIGECFSPKLADRRRGHYKHAFPIRNRLGDRFPGSLQQPVFDCRRVAMRRNVDVDLCHSNVTRTMIT